jgi:hypothetical protein
MFFLFVQINEWFFLLDDFPLAFFEEIFNGLCKILVGFFENPWESRCWFNKKGKFIRQFILIKFYFDLCISRRKARYLFKKSFKIFPIGYTLLI